MLLATVLMAIFQPIYLFLLATLLLSFSFKGNSISDHNNHEPKSLHFTLYQHDTLNKTGYISVLGAAGVGLSPTTAPFGSLYALQDPITVTSNSSSEVAGIVEGITVTSSFDGLWNLNVYKFTLRIKDHAGSIVVVGSLHSVKPSDIPVVGGTGDFKLVQGYVTTSLIDAKGFSVVYKIEFHIYWPPYAY